ncbi:hypothetical protein RRG08_049916 [Elysia crispata]|uniref:Uncharacterized protein n=1 Tax=Elysia crispata TaxID=231223 RepID=A0AAE0XZK2_9GAST|nr:hypothetical protein RRG08_049916 [Elysia crispata]
MRRVHWRQPSTEPDTCAIGSPVLASPQLPDQARREQSRIPVRQSPMEPVQPSQVDASRDRMSSTPRTRMELRRSSRLAQRKN